MNKQLTRLFLVLLCLFLFICGLYRRRHCWISSFQPNERKKFDDFYPPEVTAFLTENDKVLAVAAASRTKSTNHSLAVEYYAVISTNYHVDYIFNVPIVVHAWAFIGVRCLVVFVGDEQQMLRTPAFALVREIIRRYNALIFYVDSAHVNSVTIAQTVRIFASGLQGLSLSDDAILITSDSDLLPLTLDHHVPLNGQQIFIYNSNCCGTLKRANETFPHYPMTTIAMSVATWSNVTGASRNWLKSGDDLAARLAEEYSGEDLRSVVKGSKMWFIDQRYVSYMIHCWVTANGQNRSHLVGHHKGPIPRIDRSRWEEYKFETLNLSGYLDVHLALPLFSENIWSRTSTLFKRIFGFEFFAFLNNYRKCFLKLRNSTEFLASTWPRPQRTKVSQ